MPAVKRPAAAAAATSSKSAKVSEKKAAPLSKIELVLKAIQESEDLSTDCRAMLCAVLPSCAVPERHPVQDSMLGMVEEVLQARESSAKGLVVAAEAEAAAVEKKKDAQEQALAEVKAAAEAAQQVSAAKVAEVAQATEALEAAKVASSAAKRAHTSHAEKLQGQSEQKVALGQMEAKFTALKEGAVTGEVGSEVSSLVSEGNKLGLETGLMASVPSALSKPPESRGQFDEMVIEQVSSAIQEKQASVQAVLADRDSEAERLKTSMGEAEQAQADALAEQRARVTALEAAKEEAKKASDALSEASKAASEIASSLVLALAAVEAKNKELEDFQAGPYAAFRELRDGPKAAQVAEEKAEESAAQATAEDKEGAAPEPAAAEAAMAVSA